MSMYCLVDATSMYASCEKIYDNTVRSKPLIVLSNNDGCVVAACPIAKRLGFKKFVPYFQISEQVKAAGVVVRSSNYELYADISERMMETIAPFADDIYPYSIDELFFKVDRPLKVMDWYELGLEIRKTVWREVRLPVGAGFGPTPTLSKAANHAAKKLPGATGSAVLNHKSANKEVLTQMALSDVWGVGSRLEKRLNGMGIWNGWELAQQDPAKMRRYFSILLENTVRELNGEVRMSWDDVRPAKKEIYSTRSFGQRITERDQLRYSLVAHAEAASQKLRKQGSVAGSMVIFASNSPHDNAPYFKRSAYHSFATPTGDTRQIIAAVSEAIKELYKPGVRYYKAGVGLIDLRDAKFQQGDLFTQNNDNPELMSMLDGINKRFGRDSLTFASRGKVHKFEMRREFLSKCPTTRWSEIPQIMC